MTAKFDVNGMSTNFNPAWFKSGIAMMTQTSLLKQMVYAFKQVIDNDPQYFCKEMIREINEMYELLHKNIL